MRRDLNPGSLTGRDLAELLPYTEYVSTFNITGKKFKQAAQESLKCAEDGKNYSLFAYSDNVYIEYKCRPNKKHPVKITKILLNGKKMSGRKTYRAAAIAHIPDGYFEGAPFKITKNPQKKVYKKTRGELLFDIVEQLPGQNAAEKQLTHPTSALNKSRKTGILLVFTRFTISRSASKQAFRLFYDSLSVYASK